MGAEYFIKDAKLVEPQRDADGSGAIVVLHRIEPGVTPDYCIHGKVTCRFCDEWCWLGTETYDIVSSGRVAGVCMECATRIFAEDTEGRIRKIDHLDDHLRDEGPH